MEEVRAAIGLERATHGGGDGTAAGPGTGISRPKSDGSSPGPDEEKGGMRVVTTATPATSGL